MRWKEKYIRRYSNVTARIQFCSSRVGSLASFCRCSTRASIITYHINIPIYVMFLNNVTVFLIVTKFVTQLLHMEQFIVVLYPSVSDAGVYLLMNTMRNTLRHTVVGVT